MMSDISTAIDPSMLLERDRSRVCAAVNALDDVVRSYSHLSEPGRGSYAWDDERYQREFGLALNAIQVALKPLRTIARDWSGCPTDPEQVKAARALPLTTRLAPDRSGEEMALEVALDFADNPRPFDSLQAPADSEDELREALRVIAAAYRALTPATAPDREAITRTDILREWFGGERYARDWEYIDANFADRADAILSLMGDPQ